MSPCPQVTLGLTFASAFLALCCQGSTEEGMHSHHRPPWSRKKQDSTWIEEQLCPCSLLWAGGHRRLRVEPHARRGAAPAVVGGTCPEPGDGPGAVCSLSPGGPGLFVPPPQTQLVAVGRAVNTKRMKSTRKNGQGGKVTKQGGAAPAFLPGHCRPSCCPVRGALSSGIMQRPPRTSPVLQNLGVDL